MKAFITALFFITLFSSFTFSQEESKEYEMKTYFMVFLKKGPNRTQHDSATAAQIQKDHLANIQRLAEEGKINVAGPFLDDQELRGIFIMNVATKEEAAALVETDPAVKTGRLIYEIRPWMTAKGICFK